MTFIQQEHRSLCAVIDVSRSTLRLIGTHLEVGSEEERSVGRLHDVADFGVLS